MPILKRVLPYLFLTIVALAFYYKYFLFGLIPFPGDLLVAEYQPFRSYSYEGYVPGSVPNKGQYFDSIREFYPWLTFTIDELKNGHLPLWNPHNFSGSPHLGNFLTAVFYPFNLLYLMTDQPDAWAILAALQPLLASLFTYLYCRKIGLHTIASIFAGVAFAYSAYMNTWIQFQVIGHTILWLPLILFCIESLVEKLSARTYILLVVSLVCTVFAGHPLDFFVVMLFSGIYVLFRLWKEGVALRKRAVIASTFPVALLLGAVQLIPTIKLLANSTRAPVDYQFLIDNILIQPFQLIMFLIPDYFGNSATRNYWPTNSYVGHTLSIGITSIFFILLSWFNLKKMGKLKRYAIFFTFAIGIVLLLTTNNFFSSAIYRINIPVLSSIQPNKLLPVLAFCFSLLAAIGVDMYMESKKISRLKSLYIFITIIIMFMISLIGLLYVPLESRAVAIKQIVLSFGIASLGSVFFVSGLYVNNWKKYAMISLIMLLLIEQYYAFQKFNPFSPREFIFPSAAVLTFLQENTGINRFWGYGTAKIDSNIATQYKLYSPDGFGALNLKSYNEFIRTSKNGKIPRSFNQETRSVAEIEPGYGEIELPNNEFRLRVLDALGVKYVLNRVENPTDAKTFSPDRFKLVWQDDAGWQVFENLKSAPRFFLTNNVQKYETPEEFEKKFFDNNFNPRSMVLVENNFEDVNLCDDKNISQSHVSLERYEGSTVEFKTKSSCQSFLYLSDTYDSNWIVFIDSDQSILYKTNYSLRGVLVPDGEHTVRFEYKWF